MKRCRTALYTTVVVFQMLRMPHDVEFEPRFESRDAGRARKESQFASRRFPSFSGLLLGVSQCITERGTLSSLLPSSRNGISDTPHFLSRRCTAFARRCNLFKLEMSLVADSSKLGTRLVTRKWTDSDFRKAIIKEICRDCIFIALQGTQNGVSPSRRLRSSSSVFSVVFCRATACHQQWLVVSARRAKL